MTVYAILSDHDNVDIGRQIQQAFPASFEIGAGQHLVAVEGKTTEQVAEELGRDGENGRFIVFPITTYWGWHKQGLWEWLKLNPPK